MTAAESRPCRIIVDATCAEFGGIATYVVNVLRTWPELFPDDELHVLCPPAVARQLRSPGTTFHEVQIPKPVQLGRPFVQTRELRRLVRAIRPDAVLATLPSTTVLHLGAPTVVVIYDLRHELRPEQFSRRRRLLRRISYARGYAVADAFVSISARSLRDLHRLHPRTQARPGHVVHLGGDHVDRWPGFDRGKYAVAFGHHTNKNVDLVLDAWRSLADGPGAAPQLRITGLRGGARAHVADAVRSRGLTDCVELLPFLNDDEFERLFAGAGLIVFPSDFEGFGLPVVEAMRLGKPVVVGPDDAVLEISGGHASVMRDWTAQSLEEALREALTLSPNELSAARIHAAEFTWERTTRQSREALLSAPTRR